MHCSILQETCYIKVGWLFCLWEAWIGFRFHVRWWLTHQLFLWNLNLREILNRKILTLLYLCHRDEEGCFHIFFSTFLLANLPIFLEYLIYYVSTQLNLTCSGDRCLISLFLELFRPLVLLLWCFSSHRRHIRSRNNFALFLIPRSMIEKILHFQNY